MTEVASRELRNDTAALLRRVEAGETITITVRGRPVAVLSQVGRPRPQAISTAELFRRLEQAQADPGLADELREMNPGTTDDIPWR